MAVLMEQVLAAWARGFVPVTGQGQYSGELGQAHGASEQHGPEEAQVGPMLLIG